MVLGPVSELRSAVQRKSRKLENPSGFVSNRNNDLRVTQSGIAVVILFLFSAAPMRAVEWVEFESTVLNDGWFKYRLKVYNNPYVPRTQFHGIYVPSTNILEATSPAGWTNTIDSFGASFGLGNATNSQPYELIYLVRSGETHYRSNGVVSVLSLDVNDFGGVGIVGYINFPALVPCSAAEADGSPKTHLFTYEVGNIKIDELLRTNNQVYGVQFTVSEESTVELQGSHNLKEWDSICRFHASPPVTTWTTNSYLNPRGRFFRLALVASGHIPLSGLRADPLVQNAESAKVLNCVPRNNLIEVQIQTTAGSTYEIVMRHDRATAPSVRQTVFATSSLTSCTFPPPDTTEAVWFEATRSLD